MLTGETKVVGIMGWPVAHSLSPPMHNRAFAHLGLDWVYIPLPVAPDQVGEAIAGIKALGLVGVNVTVPHKEAVIAHLDELSREARLIGAVNTIVHRDGRLKGYNTDGEGFYLGLEEGLDWRAQGQKITILGAGGAARAIAVQGHLRGASQINIVNRTYARAEALAASLPQGDAYPWEELPKLLAISDLLVNASSYGMGGDVPPPFPAHWLRRETVVVDIVYKPRQTALLQAAASRGCATVDGLAMLLYQGVKALEIWTGEKAPVEVMAQALEDALQES
jgi:shikimate dehydrogenase